jgi:hypothetical protein
MDDAINQVIAEALIKQIREESNTTWCPPLAEVALLFKGRKYAFATRLAGLNGKAQQSRLTVVVEGELGHFPIDSLGPRDTDFMREIADQLNRHILQLNQETVNTLIKQSMRPDA